MTPRPFQPAIDPEFFWRGGPHEAAYTALRNAILRGAGVLVLTGDVGTGKSVLGHVLMDDLAREGVKVARLTYPNVDPLDFLGGVAEALGFPADLSSTDAFHAAFRRALRQAFNREERLLLVVDEAQALSPALLTEIGRLARGATTAGKGATAAMSILLIGQPDLTARLHEGDHAGLPHRIRTAYRLGSLSGEQVEEYVRHRLSVAKMESPRFDGDAIREIHAFSGGIPRVVNRVCDRALKLAERRGADVIDADIVRACLDGPKWSGDVEAGAAGAGPREAWRAVRERMAGRARTAALAVTAAVALVAVVGTVTWYVRQPSASPSVPEVATTPMPAGDEEPNRGEATVDAGATEATADATAGDVSPGETPETAASDGTPAPAGLAASAPAAGTPAGEASTAAASAANATDESRPVGAAVGAGTGSAEEAPSPVAAPASPPRVASPSVAERPSAPAPATPADQVAKPAPRPAEAPTRAVDAAPRPADATARAAEAPPRAAAQPGARTPDAAGPRAPEAARAAGTAARGAESLASAAEPAKPAPAVRQEPASSAAPSGVPPASRTQAPAEQVKRPEPPARAAAGASAPAAPRPVRTAPSGRAADRDAADGSAIIDWLLEEFRPGR